MLLLIAGVAGALAINRVVPAVSALTVAVALGVLVGNLPNGLPARLPDLRWATQKMLRTGVVLLGLQLALQHLLALGVGNVLAVLLTVAVSFLGTLALGHLLGVPRGLTMLIATGFSICGAAAIAAMEGLVKRKDSDVATAIALVTLYGGLAIFAVPLVGTLLGLAGDELGAWAGLSVHEVAQVVAAASPAGAAAVATAAVVKLSRVVLLAPIVAIVSVTDRRNTSATTGTRPPLVPPFVIGFLAMIGIRTLDVLPPTALNAAHTLTTLLLTGALFGLGTTINMRGLLRAGPTALLLGLLATLLVASVAYTTLALLT